MTITLAPEIERALNEQLSQLGTTPEGFVAEAVREKLASLSRPAGRAIKHNPTDLEPRDEWERRLAALAIHTGVSLSDEAVSRDSLYEDHL